ncbi:MAG: DUF4442 domain-containing protein [Candidatus Marinimicrobia bacterium]|nr:DUF4442 domain-containing protein [Candidatus Neomarinimicrobiota bacterium]
MHESLKSKWFRLKFNLFPAYRRTGGRITYISRDLQEVRIKLPLNWKTRNYSGTLFGGSIYAAVDPVIPMIFVKNLGKPYTVWLKDASIDYIRQGRTTLHGTFKVSEQQLEEVRADCHSGNAVYKEYTSHLVDESETVCAEIIQTIYFKLNT